MTNLDPTMFETPNDREHREELDARERVRENYRDFEAENAKLRLALVTVHKLISEAALTGFNCNDGDWAERMFKSQAQTHAALKETAEANERLTNHELYQKAFPHGIDASGSSK